MNPRHDVDGVVVQRKRAMRYNNTGSITAQKHIETTSFGLAFDAITLLSTRRPIENPAFGRNVWFAQLLLLLLPLPQRRALIFGSHFAASDQNQT